MASLAVAPKIYYWNDMGILSLHRVRVLKSQGFFHLTLAGAAIALVIFIRYESRLNTEREVKELKQQNKLAHYARWQRQFQLTEILPLSDIEIARACKTLRTTGAVISAKQRAKLQQSLEEFFTYLQLPTYTAFTNRYAGSTLNSNRLSGALMYIEKLNRAESRLLSGQDAIRAVWEAMTLRRGTSERCKITGIWAEPVQCRLSVVRSTNGYSVERALGKLRAVECVMEPTFDRLVTSSDIYKRHGQNMFADIYFVAEVNTSSNKGPFFASYYWSDSLGSWCLDRILFDPQLQFRTIY